MVRKYILENIPYCVFQELEKNEEQDSSTRFDSNKQSKFSYSVQIFFRIKKCKLL